MTQPIRISLVTSDSHLSTHLLLRLQSKGFHATCLACIDSIVGNFYSDPPDLLVIDLDTDRECAAKLVAALRGDSFFSTVPIIGLMPAPDGDAPPWETCPVDDFLVLPLDYNELFCRISLALLRIKRIFDNNPLTRLPGNASIQRAIEAAMGKSLAICYLDIDHFKPYNDVYGFSHGDEVIRMLARIMFNAVRDFGGGFCGHIGGDDFVCIIPRQQAEQICQTIIDYFDRIVLDLFDEETKAHGYFLGTNRKGEMEQIPLLAVSIAIIPLDSPKLQHCAMVGEVAAELKKLAKRSEGSVYVVDRRRD